MNRAYGPRPRLTLFSLTFESSSLNHVPVITHQDPRATYFKMALWSRSGEFGSKAKGWPCMSRSPSLHAVVFDLALNPPSFPTHTAFMMKDKSEVEEAFGEMDDLLRM